MNKTGFNKYDPRLVRLEHVVTGQLLHLSGSGVVDKPDYSWCGFKHQAEKLKEKALIRGDDFPFKRVKLKKIVAGADL